MSDCKCNELEWKEEGDVWPSEIWKCVDCNALWSVELIRDFKNTNTEKSNRWFYDKGLW